MNLLSLLTMTVLLAADPVPVAGRPTDFSGAVGGPFVVEATATPINVPVGAPIQYTLRIAGAGDLSKLRRPDLEASPEFKNHFTIEDGAERTIAEPSAREFDYVLRTRSLDAKTIPRVKFVYFNPAIKPTERGFQTTYSEGITINIAQTKIQRSRNPAFLISELYRECVMRGWDRDLHRALQEARSNVEYPADAATAEQLRPETLWLPVGLLPRKVVYPSFLLTGFFGMIMIVCAVRKRRPSRLSSLLLLPTFVVMLVTGLWIHVVIPREINTPYFVSLRDQPLHVGNGADYPIIVQLPRGVEAREIGRRGNWTHIRFASGLTGWVHHAP